jgi:hypothetical protein
VDDETQQAYIIATNAPKWVKEVTSVETQKFWDDGGDHAGESVTVYLTVHDQDGTVRRLQEAQLNSDNGWNHLWENLPKYHGGNLITYTVEEVSVPEGYTVAYGHKKTLEDGEETDIELYYDLFNFMTCNDMSDAANYAKACELLDMDSFIDYCAFNLYIFNKDSMFDNNNWRMWRVRTADGATQWSDGKWRMAVYDTDFSTGIYDGPDSANTDNISGVLEAYSDEEYTKNIEEYAPIEIFRSLLANESFQHDFILALCDMRNIYLEPKVAKKELDSMSGTYTTLLSDSWKRFGPDWIAVNPEGHHAGKLKDLSSFISKRYVAMPNMVKKIFGLESAAKLTLNTNDKTMGTILVNGRPLDMSFDFGGMYYPGLTVTVTAVPADGYKFVGWKVKKGDIADATSATLTFTIESGVTLQALFEAK